MVKGLYVKLPLMVLFMAVVAGCGSSESNSGTELLSEIVYQDKGVEMCVTAHSLDNAWVTIEDVKYLHCPKTGKRHVDSVDEGIWITEDLEQFVFLEDLDISGNFYTTFDASSLVLLKFLNMDMSFIKSLILSENMLLEKIDVGSTPLTNLDLRQNHALRDLRATAESPHTEVYQVQAIQRIDNLLEASGLPYGMGEELRKITLETIVNRSLEITLSASVVLNSLEVKSDAVIKYID